MASVSSRPNGFAKQIMDLGAITTLGLLKPDNISGVILEYPELGVQDYYIMAQEARGALKRTENTFFEQWDDDSQKFENFKVTTAVTGASAGAAVTVTLTADSHLASGSYSPVTAGHLFTDDTTGTEYIVVSVTKTTAGAHTASIRPVDVTKTAVVTTASVFLWQGRAGTVEEASDQLEGLYKTYGKRRRDLSVIRTDKAYTDFAMLETIRNEYDGMTYYDLDKSDLNKRHLYSQEYTLMQSGQKTNLTGVVGSRNSNAEGLIPQIKRWGDNLGTGVTLDASFYKQLARTSNANGSAKEYDILTDQEFLMTNEDFLNTYMATVGQVVWNRNGLSDIDIAFGFDKYKLYGQTYNIKQYELFNTQRSHGSDAPNSYLKGSAVFIPQGNFAHRDAGNLPFFTVRYMTMDGEGWINKLNSDGGFLPSPKNTKNEAKFSLTSYKGLETYNIGAYKFVQVDTNA